MAIIKILIKPNSISAQKLTLKNYFTILKATIKKLRQAADPSILMDAFFKRDYIYPDKPNLKETQRPGLMLFASKLDNSWKTLHKGSADTAIGTIVFQGRPGHPNGDLMTAEIKREQAEVFKDKHTKLLIKFLKKLNITLVFGAVASPEDVDIQQDVQNPISAPSSLFASSAIPLTINNFFSGKNFSEEQMLEAIKQKAILDRQTYMADPSLAIEKALEKVQPIIDQVKNADSAEDIVILSTDLKNLSDLIDEITNFLSLFEASPAHIKTQPKYLEYVAKAKESLEKLKKLALLEKQLVKSRAEHYAIRFHKRDVSPNEAEEMGDALELLIAVVESTHYEDPFKRKIALNTIPYILIHPEFGPNYDYSDSFEESFEAVVEHRYSHLV